MRDAEVLKRAGESMGRVRRDRESGILLVTIPTKVYEILTP
jgi:hypothetical protein